MKKKLVWGVAKKYRPGHRLGRGGCDVRQIVKAETAQRWEAHGRSAKDLDRVVVRG